MFSQTDLQTTFIQSANLRVENNFSKDDMATIFILFGSIIIDGEIGHFYNTQAEDRTG